MQTPYPNTAHVIQQTADTLAALGTPSSQCSANCRRNRHRPRRRFRGALVRVLAAQFRGHAPTSWDEFVQYYLALVAIDRSRIDAVELGTRTSTVQRRFTDVTAILEAIRNRLSFPVDSPETTSAASPLSGGPAVGGAGSQISPVVKVTAPSPNLRVLRSGFNSPLNFDPHAKAANVGPNDLAGKSLFDLFEDAFQILSAGT